MKSGVGLLLTGVLLTTSAVGCSSERWEASRGLLIKGATIVTMNDDHNVIPDGHVLIRDGVIVDVWTGPKPHKGVSIGDPQVITVDANYLVFPGLINLHSHPAFNVLPTWLPPASHAIPEEGKEAGEPYATRYQWREAPEYRRLVSIPHDVLTFCFGYETEIVKYAETGALLGGETAIQGSGEDSDSNTILIRNVEADNFGRESRVATYSAGNVDLANVDRSDLVGKDAWFVHVAEGVRGDLRSHNEFATLKARGLLTDATVIIHGTALERADFAAMRTAGPLNMLLPSGVSVPLTSNDQRGAKLVWSPLSNLLLYGTTTRVYDALAEGVLVSLGTDWTPSGSHTLLHELKVADVVLRSTTEIAGDRGEVPELASDFKLDRALVDMVTRNPALTLHWYDKVGSIEPGKIADLVLLRKPTGPPPDADAAYRALIDASERDIELVLLGGEPLAGTPALMARLKPFDTETVTSDAGGFTKAVDVTSSMPVKGADERFATFSGRIRDALDKLDALDSGVFASGVDQDCLKLYGIHELPQFPGVKPPLALKQLTPLFQADDDFLQHIVHADINPTTGLIDDPTPPYDLYPANLNHLPALGDALDAVA